MSTDASAVGELLRLVLTVYLAVAIMGIGFGTMFAGGDGASAAARSFFLRPLQMLFAAAMKLVAMVFAGIAHGFVILGSMVGRATRREVKELVADVRWLVRRFDR